MSEGPYRTSSPLQKPPFDLNEFAQRNVLIKAMIGTATIAVVLALAALILVGPGLLELYVVSQTKGIPMVAGSERYLHAVILTIMTGGFLFFAYKISRGFVEVAVDVGKHVLEYIALWRENRK